MIFDNEPRVSPEAKMKDWKLQKILKIVCILELMLMKVV